jgi:hypothetical protein
MLIGGIHTAKDLRVVPIPLSIFLLLAALSAAQREGGEGINFPPFQGEGKGGGGVNQMSIQLRAD